MVFVFSKTVIKNKNKNKRSLFLFCPPIFCFAKNCLSSSSASIEGGGMIMVQT